MRSPNFKARTSLECAEFARNIVTHALYLVERVKPDQLVLAVDYPENWRTGVYTRYYETNVDFYQYLGTGRTWIVQFDRKTYLVKYESGMDKWVYAKLPAKEVEGYKLKDPAEWKKWRRSDLAGCTQDTDLDEESIASLPHPDWPALDHIIPRYKGNRSTSKWDYETTKAEFRALGANLAFNLAPALGGVAVQVPQAEGDDVCATWLYTSEGWDTTLVTIDTDLHQLLITCPDLRIFDPRLHTWVDKSAELAAFELTKKILCGDTSDNICGISLRGKSQTLGPKTSERLIESNGGVEGIWDYLAREADQAPLDRNLELIALNYIPAEIRQAIEDKLQERLTSPESSLYGLQDFGLTAKDQLLTKTAARLDKELDDGIREGDPIAHETLGAVE
jgi:5'-3' exonuclease